MSKKDCEKAAETITTFLQLEGVLAHRLISFYHAGLEAEERTYRHQEWHKGNIKLMIATTAFGMGINKHDVRYVIHHSLPQTMNHFYQE